MPPRKFDVRWKLRPKHPIALKSEEVEARLSERCNVTERHQIAKRDLLRYYRLINETVDNLNLTEPECLFLLDALEDFQWEDKYIDFWWGIVEVKVRKQPALLERWHMEPEEGHAMLEKIKAFKRAEIYAFLDALERVHFLTEEMNVRNAIREVGLVKD